MLMTESRDVLETVPCDRYWKESADEKAAPAWQS